MDDHSDLKEKIGEAKRRLPLPELMAREGLSEHAKKEAHCPFHHPDKHESFSVFRGDNDFWHWKCFAGCGEGDEIMFVSKLKGLSLTDAMNLYLEQAGFPACAPHKSREYPKSPESHNSPECPESLSICVSEFPCVSVSPVSKGQEEKKAQALKALGARNACCAAKTARKTRWKLVRDLRALEKGIGRELSIGELMEGFDEWYRLSQPFLDPAKTRDTYLAAFLAELRKVRVPTGEGDRIKKALEYVSALPPSELPMIPGVPDAPKNWRRLVALHRELSRLCGGNIYYLSYRDAAKVCNELSHQSAHTITLALARVGVIEIVRKGKAGLNSRKAAEFRYLLSQSENGEAETNGTMMTPASPSERRSISSTSLSTRRNQHARPFGRA